MVQCTARTLFQYVSECADTRTHVQNRVQLLVVAAHYLTDSRIVYIIIYVFYNVHDFCSSSGI